MIYKRPRSFELVEENVRDDAGKVRRSALRGRTHRENEDLGPVRAAPAALRQVNSAHPGPR